MEFIIIFVQTILFHAFSITLDESTAPKFDKDGNIDKNNRKEWEQECEDDSWNQKKLLEEFSKIKNKNCSNLLLAFAYGHLLLS
jgi:hypothetical protein